MKGQITREYTVWCGGCSRWQQEGIENRKAGAAKRFRALGWSLTKERGWLCKACVKHGPKADRDTADPTP